VAGLVPVRVITTGPVASVTIELDGRPLVTMRAPEWSADVDLGPELSPHELAARALDPDGKTLASCHQWLNLPRRPAEVEVVLERGADGRAQAARLSWQSLTPREPRGVEATLNGKPLTVSPDRRLELPPYDPRQPQLLSVELEFENDVKSRKDVVLGGGSGSEAGSELTSVPIRWRDGGEPNTSTLKGRLVGKGQTLGVAAVETGPASLWIVRDSAATEAARHLGERGLQMFTSRWGNSGRVPGGDLNLRLDAGDRIRFVWPRPMTVAGSSLPTDLFPTSHTFIGDKVGVRWLLRSVQNPAPETAGARFSDAVAVAGLNAYAGFQRRAVLLVLGSSDVDESQYSVDAVRRYLVSLHVPLFVWSLGSPSKSAGAWSEARDVSTAIGMLQAFSDIRRNLASQRIVWVEGRLLPQEIGLAPESGSIELAR
jgi:hypothetical protein